MKRKILMMLSISLLTGTALTTMTLEPARAMMQEPVGQQNPERKSVDQKSLPQTVKDRMEREGQEWSLNSAFLISSNPAYYEITMTNEEGQRKVLKLNEQGLDHEG